MVKDYGKMHLSAFAMGISDDDLYLFTADGNGIVKQWSVEKKIVMNTEVVILPKDLEGDADPGNKKIRFLCV